MNVCVPENLFSRRELLRIGVLGTMRISLSQLVASKRGSFTVPMTAQVLSPYKARSLPAISWRQLIDYLG